MGSLKLSNLNFIKDVDLKKKIMEPPARRGLQGDRLTGGCPGSDAAVDARVEAMSNWSEAMRQRRASSPPACAAVPVASSAPETAAHAAARARVLLIRVMTGSSLDG